NGQLTDARNATFEDGTVDMLGNGALVEVSGRIAGGMLLASTVEIEHATVVQVDGTVQAVDNTAGSVTVGGQLVRVTNDTQYLDTSSLAVAGFSLASLRIGDRVSILAFQGSNGLIATRLQRVDIDTPPPGQPSTSVQGTISNFVSIGNFIVSGQQVNAGAAGFVGGTAANLANGVSVSVQGTIANGVLNAATIQFVVGNPGPTPVSVTGTISAFISVANFTVAGQRVDASSASFGNSSVSDLAHGT